MRESNVEGVLSALASGEDPNQRYDEGLPILMKAVLTSEPQIIRALLDAGACPNSCVEPSRINALMWAAASSPEIARILLEAGADPNATEAHTTGSCPIHWAMNGRKTEVKTVRVLVEHGANVNSLNWMGETPLYLAARHRRLDLVRLLLSAGADPDIATREGYTAWSWSYGFLRRGIRRELSKFATPQY